MACDPEFIPDFYPMAAEGSAAACAGSWAAVVVALALVVWRTVPAATGHRWSPHPDPMHLDPAGQRLGDVVLPLGFLVGAFGMAGRDWGWQAAGFGTMLAWVLGTILLGLRRQRVRPEAAPSTATLLDVGAGEPVDAPPPPPRGVEPPS